MSNPLHDAITANLPANSRRIAQTSGTKIIFNCPICASQGHGVDKRQRGTVFLNHDGSAGYNCFNCKFRTRQDPDKALCEKMKSVLEAFRMDSLGIARVSHAMWSRGVNKRTGTTAPPAIKQQAIPSGAKPIGEWIAANIADHNFNDVLLDLAEMSDSLRDSYYWTPEAGESGDMNRRFIWVIEEDGAQIGWGAHPLSTDYGDDEESIDVLFSDPNIMFRAE